MVELMVVVAILGITAALTVRSFTQNPTGEGARKVASMMATAMRTATGGGPLRADIAAATGSKARAELEFYQQSGQVLINVYVLVEDPLPASTSNWRLVSSEILSPDTQIFTITDNVTAVPIDPGTSPTATALPGAAPGIIKRYFPDGTADPMAVFLKHRTNNAATRYRVLGLSLNPAPQVFQDW